MNPLELVKSHVQESEASERVEQIEKDAGLILSVFDACLEALKYQNITLSTAEISTIEGQKGVDMALEGMSPNEARYLRVSSHELGNDSERHILVIKRSTDSENLMTFFSVRTGETVERAMVFQESLDKELGLTVQENVFYDPESSFILDSKKSMIVAGEFIGPPSENFGLISEDERVELRQKKRKTAHNSLDKIAHRATSQPVKEATSEHIAEVTRTIKQSVRGKGRIRALGAVIKHMPQEYHQQRQQAA